MNKVYIKHHADEEELMHFGIMGMKWGRRRYQNEDGSLTSAGRAHYGVKGERKSSDSEAEAKAAKKAAKAEARAVKKAARAEKRAIKARNKKMSTLEGSIDEALNNMSDKELANETARYRATNDYIKAKLDLNNTYLSTKPKKLSTAEKMVNAAATAANIAGSVGKIYDAYKKLSGGNSPTPQERIALEKSRLDLENTRLNLRRTSMLARKAAYDFNKSINDDAWNSRVNRAKRSSIFRTKSLSDEQLYEYTQRHKRENEFIDELFKQFDKAKK